MHQRKILHRSSVKSIQNLKYDSNLSNKKEKKSTSKAKSNEVDPTKKVILSKFNK